MTVGRGLQIFGGLVAFAGVGSMMGGAADGVTFFGNAVALVIGLLLFAWGSNLHNKKR